MARIITRPDLPNYYSYTLTGQSKYLRRMTGRNTPVVKRPIHTLGDGTAVAMIFDDNDAGAKYGSKNNAAQILLCQSDVNRTGWAVRATYVLPAGTFPTDAATLHGGTCLMLNEDVYVIWRGPAYQIYGAKFTKTGSTTWTAPTSAETLYTPGATQYPFRFDLDINRVTGHLFIGFMYRDDTSIHLRTGVKVIIRKAVGDIATLAVADGIGTTGNVAHANNAEDFTLAVDPMSDASTTRIAYLTTGVMTTKDYGDYVGWLTVNNSTKALISKNWIKTGLNAGQGGGHRTSYMFATGNGEIAIIGVMGTTNAVGFACKYKTVSAVSSLTPSWTASVALRYSTGTHEMNRTNSLNADCSVTYANNNFAVHFHDNYFRNLVGKFYTPPPKGSVTPATSVVWETPNYTWDSFVGKGITITDDWRKSPASGVYGGARNADASNVHDTLLVYFSRSALSTAATAWAAQHNRPWKAPNTVAPSAGTVVNTGLPTLSAYADLDQPGPRSYTFIKWQIASNSSFTTGLKEIETTTGVAVNDTHLDGSQVFIGQVVPQDQAIKTGTWYIRAAQRDSFGTYGAYSSTQQFSVSHAPWGTDLDPSGGVIFEYGTGNVTFTWKFHDVYSLDTQTAYRILIETNDDAGLTVLDTGKVEGSDPFATVLVPATAKNTELKWRVQLWDSDDSPGELSGYAIFTIADPPVVTITSPVTGTTIDNARPQVEWTTDDPLETGQAGYRVTFISDGVVIHDSGWRNGADQAYQPDDIILQNDSSYTLWVHVIDGAGLVSLDHVDFDTEWVLPTDPDLTSLMADATHYTEIGGGYVKVMWDIQAADPEFLSWRLYRRYHLANSSSPSDRGWNWELIHEEFSVSPPDGSDRFYYLDYSAPSGYTVHYILTQAAVRFGSIVESNMPSTGDIGAQVSLYSEHYWLIMPDADGDPQDVMRLENTTADSYTEEYESEEMHLIGRGRHFEIGDRLGYSGQLTIQLRFIEGSGMPEDPRRQKLDLEQFKAKRTECLIRSPFGDLFTAFTSDMQFERIAGVGSSEFTNVTLPYKEVYSGNQSNQ